MPCWACFVGCDLIGFGCLSAMPDYDAISLRYLQ